MAETNKKKQQPDRARDKKDRCETPGHRYEHKERVFEEGQDEHNDPNPSRENLSGTPLGSDPRE